MTAAQLLALAQDYIPESDPLHGKIGAYLGEPVHVGDTITVKMRSGWGDSWGRKSDAPVPEGLEVTSHHDSYEHEGETRNFTYQTYVFPEAGEARYSKTLEGFVVDINGRRYRVDIYIDAGEETMGCDGGAVSFTRTDDPLTDFEPWSHDEAVAKYRASQVRQMEANQAKLDKDPDNEWAEYNREEIEDCKKQIAKCDAGEIRFRHPYYMQVFGQPHFLQNEVFPTHEGRCAMALASIETGWGDSGNVNILFACDSDGIPCRVWFEASCC